MAIGSQFAVDGSSTLGAMAPQSGSQMRRGGGNGCATPTGSMWRAHNDTIIGIDVAAMSDLIRRHRPSATEQTAVGLQIAVVRR